MRESDSVLSLPVEWPFLVRCHASELLISVRSGDGCSELAMLRMIERRQRAFCVCAEVHVVKTVRTSSNGDADSTSTCNDVTT